MFGDIATHRAADLVPRVEAWAPDLVVHPITELAAAVAAARTGARHVVHNLGPLPSENWSWLSAPFGELCDVWGVPALADEMVDRPYLDTCPPSLQEDAVSAFRDRRLLRASSGDVLPGERLPRDDATLAALPFEHTVHLTLGTIFNGLTDVFQTALAGLARLPVNVLVTVGPGGDPASLGPQPPHELVTDFAPHAPVLPRCSVLVTQGGAGTIFAALCHGRPHLILPQGADQFANAATAEQAGLALRLTPREDTADAIATAVRQLRDDPGITAAARAVESEIASMPSPDDVLATILVGRPPPPPSRLFTSVSSGDGS